MHYREKTREKVADVLDLIQRLNSLVFQPDCDKLSSVANSLSPCGASTLPFLWPAHLSGTLVSGPGTAIYDSPRLIFYWPNYYNQKIRYELGLSEGRKTLILKRQEAQDTELFQCTFTQV